MLQDIKCKVMGRFAITDMRDVSMVLGMLISRHREVETLTISQDHYARSVPARFDMAEYNPMHTTGAGAEIFLQAAGHDAARLYGHPTLPGHHGVSDVLEAMHSLRHHLRRQPTSPSHAQTVQTAHDRSKSIVSAISRGI